MTQTIVETGTRSAQSGFEAIGLRNLAALRWNDDEKTLFFIGLGTRRRR